MPDRPDRPTVSPRGVYLAGPSGFFDAGRLWHETVVVPAVVASGLVPMDPWADQSAITDVLSSSDPGPARRAALQRANCEQGRYDLELIDRSAAILASLDGVDVDSGTALEIGYGFAHGLIIVGLRTDIRLSGDNEGSVVNLMIETCIVDSGGIMTASLDEAIGYLARRLPRDQPLSGGQ